METNNMTDIEVIKDAIDSIGRLSIPVAMYDPLGAELNRVRNNLMILHKTILENREAAQNEPEIEIGEAEDVPEEE